MGIERVDQFSRRALALAVATALLTACGGGGGGSSGGGDGGGADVAGLTMPAKLSVVTDTDSGGGSAAGMLKAVSRAISDSVAGFPAGSEYHSDRQNVWVWDDSMQSLSSVNDILCQAQQTAADEMVNKGAYIAQINTTKCSGEGANQSGATQGGGQSSGSSQQTQTEYERWTVLSTRANDDSPQVVKIWIPGKAPDPAAMGEGGEMDAQRILAEITINESPSAAKPFGDFVLNFKGTMPGDVMASLTGGEVTTDTDVMEGTLKSLPNAGGQPQFSFINLGGQAMGGTAGGMPFTMVEKTNVVLDDATGTGGVARTFFSERSDHDGDGTFDDSRGDAYDVAFNASHFLAARDTSGDGTPDPADPAALRCTDRTQFNTQVWRYNLYHAAAGTFGGSSVAAGQRVRLNSGFPIRYTAGGQERYGNVGYWGVWTEGGQGLADGQLVERETYSQQAGEQYRINLSAGKLHKRTKRSTTMAKMVGATLNWYGDPDRDNSVPSDGPLPERDYRLTIVDTGAGYAMKITGGIDWTDNGPKLVAVGGITPEDPATWVEVPMPADYGQDSWMWSDSLGGSVVVRWNGSAVEVVFFQEETVSPGTAGLNGTTVTCYERCLKGGLTGAVATEADLFHILWNDGTQSHTYRIDTSGGTIAFIDLDPDNNPGTTATAAVTIDDADLSALVAANPWYEWGVQSGEMVTSDTAVANWWEVFDAATTYRWATGGSEWNRQVSVTKVSDGSLVDFDKPLHLTYAYGLGDDPNGDRFPAATTFMLEYGGPGQLWGFPSAPEEGCDVASEQCRWYSELNLKDGVELSDGSNAFVVKGLDMEKTMSPAAGGTGDCVTAGLNVDNVSLTLPNAIDEHVTTTWGQKDATAIVKVIEGEVQ